MNNQLVASGAAFLTACYLFIPTVGNQEVKPLKLGQKKEVVVVPDPIPAKTGIIEVQTADWCPSCRRMKASNAIKELEAKGWKIQYTNSIEWGEDGKHYYPSFRVWVDGKNKVMKGYYTKADLFIRIRVATKELGG